MSETIESQLAYKVQFRLTSKTPLLMHADNLDMVDELEAWRKDPTNKKTSKAGDDRSPPWTWLSYLHHDGEHVSIPTDMLSANLRNAGARLSLKGQKSFKEMTQTGIYFGLGHYKFVANGKQVPFAELVALRDLPFAKQSEAVKRFGFSLFCKRAPINNSASRHLRVRPRFENWQVSGKIGVFDNAEQAIDIEKLIQIFDVAGGLGLGDWRPGGRTPGPFGQYVAEVKKIK